MFSIRSKSNNFAKWQPVLHGFLDYFFTKEILMSSNATGKTATNNTEAAGNVALDPLILDQLRGTVFVFVSSCFIIAINIFLNPFIFR